MILPRRETPSPRSRPLARAPFWQGRARRWFGAGAVALILLGLALTARWPVPPALQAALERELAQRFGAAVHWQAPAQLALWPRPHLQFIEVHLAWPAAAVAAGRHELEMAQLDVFFAWRPRREETWQLVGLHLHGAEALLVPPRDSAAWQAFWGDMRALLLAQFGSTARPRTARLRFVEMTDVRMGWRAPPQNTADALHPLDVSGRLQRAAANGPWRLYLEGAHGPWPMELTAELGAWAGERVPLDLRWRQTDDALAAEFRGHVETRADGELSGEWTMRGASLARHFLRPLGLELADTEPPHLRGVMRARRGRISFENFVFTSALGRMFAALHMRLPPPDVPDVSVRAPVRVDARLRMGAVQLEALWARRALRAARPSPPADWLGWWQPRLAGALEGRVAFSAAHMALGGAVLQLDGALEFSPTRLWLDEWRLALPQAGTLLARGALRTSAARVRRRAPIDLRTRRPQFDGTVSLRSTQSRALVAWLVRLAGGDVAGWQSGLPAQALRQLDGDARLRLSEDGIWLDDIQLRLDGARHSGRVHRLHAPPSRLTMEWQSSELALDALGLSPLSAEGGAAARRTLMRLAQSLLGARQEWELRLAAERVRFGSDMPRGEAFALDASGRAGDVLLTRLALDLMPSASPSLSPAAGSVALSGRLHASAEQVPFALGGWLDLQLQGVNLHSLLPPSDALARLPTEPLEGRLYWRAPPHAGGAELSGQGRLGASSWRVQLASPVRRIAPVPQGARLVISADGPAAPWRVALGLPAERARQTAQDEAAQDEAQLQLTMERRADGGWNSAAQFALSGAEARLGGVLRGGLMPTRFDGQVAFEGHDWTRLWPTARTAAWPAAPFRVRARLSYAPAKLAFSHLQLAWDDNRLHGEGVWRWQASRPRLVANLHFSRLQLSDNLFAADAALDWEGLAAFNAAVEWSAAELVWRGWRAHSVRATMRLHDSVMEFQPAVAALYGGSWAGAVRLEGGALIPSVHAQGRVRNVDAARLLGRAWQPPPLAARLETVFALKSHGRSWRAHLAQLEGGGNLQLEGGRLAGMELAALAHGAERLQSLDEIAPLLARSLGEGASEFAVWRGRYDWRNGVLTMQDAPLILSDGLGEGRLQLRYDARTNQLDSTLEVRLAPTRPQGKALPPWQMRLSGAPQELALRFVTDGLAEELSARVLRHDEIGELGLPPALP